MVAPLLVAAAGKQVAQEGVTKAATEEKPAAPKASPAAAVKTETPKPAGPKPPSLADGGASPSAKPKMEPQKLSSGGGNKGGMAFSAAGQLANNLSKLEGPIKNLAEATSSLSKGLEQVAKPLGQIADAAKDVKNLRMK